MRCAVGLSPAGRLTEFTLQATLSKSCRYGPAYAVFLEHTLPDKPAGFQSHNPLALVFGQPMLLLYHCTIKVLLRHEVRRCFAQGTVHRVALQYVAVEGIHPAAGQNLLTTVQQRTFAGPEARVPAMRRTPNVEAEGHLALGP